MSSYPPTPQRKACDCSDPCISTDDVYYAGPNLPNSGINTYNVLTEVIEKLDAIYAVPTATYKVYTALLSQSGELEPVATVLENTLGETLSYTRIAGGIYVITTTGIFPQDKTWAVINTPSYEGNGPFALQIGRVNDTQCQIYAYQLPDTLLDLGTNSDRVSIEIRVYN